MKRYMLFTGLYYDHGCGASDFLSDHDSLEEAKMVVELGDDISEWAQIFDTEKKSAIMVNLEDGGDWVDYPWLRCNEK